MLKCPSCGQENISERSTCKKCGASLVSAELIAPPENPLKDILFDKKDQFDKISSALIPGEQVLAVFDMKGGGTGFLGITNKRLIIYDKSFLRKMKALISIPFSRVYSIAGEDDSGLFTGRGFFSSSKLVITTVNGEHEFEFRGADKAHIAHDLIIKQIV